MDRNVEKGNTMLPVDLKVLTLYTTLDGTFSLFPSVACIREPNYVDQEKKNARE